MLLLGYRVAAAFGVRREYFARQKIGTATAVVVPHPSGVNRWWNDSENVRRMERFMRGLVEGRIEP